MPLSIFGNITNICIRLFKNNCIAYHVGQSIPAEIRIMVFLNSSICARLSGGFVKVSHMDLAFDALKGHRVVSHRKPVKQRRIVFKMVRNENSPPNICTVKKNAMLCNGAKEKKRCRDDCQHNNVNYLVSEFVTNDMVAQRNIDAVVVRARAPALYQMNQDHDLNVQRLDTKDVDCNIKKNVLTVKCLAHQRTSDAISRTEPHRMHV